ncbi:MAG TPA: trypsin-like peptidase domain-containing protein [Candidatus Baltobacteraceae bacterium]|nr:trypsin-like peptidase domain-containing protein [Candidatus Baltobacteraceae bacterium]
MSDSADRIVIVDADLAGREALQLVLRGAGYDVAAFATAHEGLESVRQAPPNLLLLNALLCTAGTVPTEPALPHAHDVVAAVRGNVATEQVRVVLFVGSTAEERATALDLGADDAISQPFDPAELLARVRAQVRAYRADSQLLTRARLAEEGQQMAQTAFQALAVTEKMTSDAFSLNRTLKIGVGAAFAIAVVMAGTYFLFFHSAKKDVQRTNATITRLEHGIMNQQNMLAEVRRLRDQQESAAGVTEGKDELQRHAAALRAQMAGSNDGQTAELQKELDETNARLKRLETEGDSADTFIAKDVQSVCLLHVTVAFRNQQTSQRLRYAGLNPKGEPIQDSDGNPILTLEGNGPEVTVDVFGTGFTVGANGRVITNRHVAEPWWNNDELSDLTSQGFQAEISSIRAYFPGDSRAFHAEIDDISKDADLATMRVDMQNLKRPALSIDPAKGATAPGDPVVLMGYATGLAAILARTDENTAQQIVTESGGDVSQVLDALAHRDLIHPLITQGHIGDVLPDKIVFDAQTTSGGSGGPLFNQQGKVVGVTYAILKGFGGSNFGIPIRLSEPLLVPDIAHASN